MRQYMFSAGIWKRVALVAAAVAMLGCGGKSKDKGLESPGDSPGDEPAVSDGADAGTAEAAPVEPEVPEAPKAPVTFVLRNDGTDDLLFSIDKGWQPLLFAFTGKPPKAKAIIMFPKANSASCEAPDEERCPVAPPAPEKAKDVIAAEKREIVAAGQTLEVPWDAAAFAYEKTKVGKKKCECYRAAPAEPATYSVRACGLRKVGDKTKVQCADGEMTLPSPDGAPMTVELSFPALAAPPAKPAKK
jgi:hypothetical protein